MIRAPILEDEEGPIAAKHAAIAALCAEGAADLLAENAALRAENATLKSELAALKAASAAKIAELTTTVELLLEKLRLLAAKLYGTKSEKTKDIGSKDAPPAADEDESEDGDGAAGVPDTGMPDPAKPKAKKRGRKPLSPDLPRVDIEHDLPEDKKICPCCGEPLHRLPPTVTEMLQILVKVWVERHIRHNYTCRNCQRKGTKTPFVPAPMPVHPMPGSPAAPATLALALVSKFADGMPFYRLAQIFARAGCPITRGTLAKWAIRSVDLHLQRIYDALKQAFLSQPVIHGDETWIQVLKEKGRKAESKSYVFAYRGGPIVLLEYQPGRSGEYIREFLEAWVGKADEKRSVMSDGYNAWRTVEGARHLGCMAHARRHFRDALKATKMQGGLAAQALEFFHRLYEVEKLAKQEQSGDETVVERTLRLRKMHSRPVLLAFRRWLDEKALTVAPETKLGQAISYARNQWKYLTRYTKDGRAPIDNNLLERDIRKFVTGRKNWLFADTPAGARASAVIHSLVLTCRACDVDPQAWLCHVFTELPQRAENADIQDLLPFNFQKSGVAANTS